MNKKEDKNKKIDEASGKEPTPHQNVVGRSLVTEMRESYIDYAMSVITDRALPDVRDGLKPVHRRILYTMYELGLNPGGKTRKSAKIIGDVTGNYHPHGTAAAYGAMVGLAQEFTMRYPLAIGQGNFGCFTKDTKVRLADGRSLSFGDLIKEDNQGKRNYTFTVKDGGDIGIALIRKPRLTKKSVPIMKVVLDNGEEIRCTLNHKFLLKNQTYVEAENLKEGDSLMPLYTRLSTKEDAGLRDMDGYEMIYEPINNSWKSLQHLFLEFNISKVYERDLTRTALMAPGNHKVKKIVFLNEREDVYDLTIDHTHNFALGAGVFVHNSIDGDPPAADRYTEAKMSRLALLMLGDIEKESVDWQANYENTRKEPKVLPAAVPNLLLNGTLGIAVGMATNIPPHNLSEILLATMHLIDEKDATTEDLLQFVKGPDFPTGGIIYGKKDMLHAYTTGRGSVVVRGEAEIIEDKAGMATIVITSIPYRVNKAELIISIADLVREKKLEGIKDLRDESTKDVRIVIELKKGAYPQTVLNFLYKHTRIEESFHFNVVGLVDGVPQTLSLKSLLSEFISHRKIVIKRRTEFDLRKAEDREHILFGLKKALDHIDEIIKLIKKSKNVEEARTGLIKEFKFSERQANAILEMKLQRLSGLERKKIEDELAAVRLLIVDLKDILENPKRIPKIIKDELISIREKYGDERRTKVVASEAKTFSIEDVIPDDEAVLVYTSGGYIKRTDPDEYRKQKRGGVGVVDLDTKEEDFITHLVTASNHSDLLFFTDKGKVYQIKMYEIPEGKRATRGKSIANFLALSPDEKITSILPMPKDIKKAKAKEDDSNSSLSLFLVTKAGTGKKVKADNFHDVRRSGIIAIRLDDKDELVTASFVEKGDEIMTVSSDGQSIKFAEEDVREMGRSAGGVRVMKLDRGVILVGADVVKKGDKDALVFVVSKNGYGKKTEISEFKTQGRGGSGVKAIKVTEKTGQLISAKIITGEYEEAVAISKKGQVIRCGLNEIPTLGRDTQGVRVMKLREGDALASVICL